MAKKVFKSCKVRIKEITDYSDFQCMNGIAEEQGEYCSGCGACMNASKTYIVFDGRNHIRAEVVR